MKKLSYLLLLAILPLMAKSEKRKILFIGNSYTQYNNLPNTFKSLALSLGDSVEVDSYTPGGYSFLQQSQDATTISKIQQIGWDCVVLQAQSQEPSFPPAQVASDTYPYAKKLDSMIKAANPCAETVFYMTWGKKNGDASNCASYPVICTYGGVAMRLRESYLEMTQLNNATCSPVGVSWDRIITQHPTIELFNADGSHPNANGTYLTACTFYSTIYHKSSVGASYILSGVSASDATLFQTTATNTVMDSIENWQQHGGIPKAGFSSSNTLNQFNFTNQSLRSTQYEWNFGDGSPISNAVTPSHTYTSVGTFPVTLKASNTCGKYEVVSKNIQVTSIPSALNEIYNNPNPAVSYYNGQLVYSGLHINQLVNIFSMNGTKIQSFKPENSKGNTKTDTSFSNGIYLYQVIDGKKIKHHGKFEVNE